MVVGKAQKEVVGMHSMQASKPKRLDWSEVIIHQGKKRKLPRCLCVIR